MECAVSGGNKLISGRNLDSNFRRINFPIIQVNKIIAIILTLIFIAKSISYYTSDLLTRGALTRFGLLFLFSYKNL